MKMNFAKQRNLIFIILTCMLLSGVGCSKKSEVKRFKLFGNVYRLDSVAGQKEFDEPRYVVLTKDSLFQAFGYWDYSFVYETKLKINDSLEVLNLQNEKYVIEPIKEGFWLNLPNGKRYLYSQAPGRYDSAYKHLRIMKTQESLLFGKWKFSNNGSIAKDRSEGKSILTCGLNESSILRFTRWDNHKIVQVESFIQSKMDSCLRRDFRLDGSSVLIFDYDIFTPWTLIELDAQNLVMQGPDNILYFEKVKE